MRRIHFKAEGIVQGVGYRYFARHTARRLNLTGWVANRPDGSVEGEAEGEDDAVEKFAENLKRRCPGAAVRNFEITDLPVLKSTDENDFEIRYY